MNKNSKNLEPTLTLRAPVVTIMGHVDHGKTTLLDYIRKTRIAEKEYGGITQQVRTYQIQFNNYPITFIDTPGHEAFVAMRERGAKVTDIIVLVVAADDGVMPQTKEVINLWKSIRCNLIVAINKVDLPTANVERTKNDLLKEEVYLEGYGGDIPYVEISAKFGTNVDKLLDLINLVAELNEIHKFTDISNADFKSEMIVLESYLDKAVGPIANVIIKLGKLKRGDFVVGSNLYSRIRAIINDSNLTIDEAVESMPVKIIGLPTVVEVGEILRTYDKESVAREKSKISSFNNEKLEMKERFTKAYLASKIQEQKQNEDIQKLNIILIADTKGSLEAITYALKKINISEVKLDIIQIKVGVLSQNDIDLAKIKNSIILGFNIKPDYKVLKYAEINNVLFKNYNIIYELVDEVKDVMLSLIDTDNQDEEAIGEGIVLQIFELSNGKFVIGSRVNKGLLARNCTLKIVRGDSVIHEGKIVSLKHLKEDVKEINAGMDCGILLEPNFGDLKQGDKIFCYKKK